MSSPLLEIIKSKADYSVRTTQFRSLDSSFQKSRLHSSMNACIIFSRAQAQRFRVVAQFGSALDWGSRGRWFESSPPDHERPGQRLKPLTFFLYVLFTYCKPCSSFLLKSILVFAPAARNCSANGRHARLRARSAHQECADSRASGPSLAGPVACDPTIVSPPRTQDEARPSKNVCNYARGT